MIGREFIGKSYPPFSVELSEAFCREMAELIRTSPSVVRPIAVPPANWPAIMTLHGTACLMRVWEDLAVDPLRLRQVREEFVHVRPAICGERLSGTLTIEDVTEHYEPKDGMFQQLHLETTFVDDSGKPVATYHCSYAFPLTAPPADQKQRGISRRP